jgi:RNA polymerase sigma factor (sigma-70 family)
MKTTRISPFPQTQWTALVNVCKEGTPERQRQALDTLCQDYWYPLYAFARRSGNRRQDAEDLTQGFFHYLLERGLFSAADQELGKLRTFLLTAFQRYASDARNRSVALKRGGGREIVSLDVEEAEKHFDQPSDALTAQEVFDRHWAHAILQRTLARLNEMETSAGKGGQFTVLQLFLMPSSTAEGNYDEVAAALGITGDAARKAVSRLRGKFREMLRTEIGETLATPSKEQVDEELNALKSALRG